ncbi:MULTISPECIES: histidine phosphatase family protein [unclassified Actinomadura]|uniref:histidine phosphatase family protein n=1 Tax=unclassified Actinomadura TaxID=2626254 RepID=UPI001F1D77D3|nr:histidine phosphatase family protein [Actinomadura sp. K4S16]
MPRPRRERAGLTGLLLVRHATSAGMRQARFPAGDAADPAGLARAEALAGALPDGDAWTSPARAARETCTALGLAARPVAALAEADPGTWAGVHYADIAPDALAAWLADPDAAPHGGESRSALAARVAAWLGTGPSGIAVCDAGVIRAALAHALRVDVLAADRFDVAPLSTTRLTPAGNGWRVAHVNRKVQV